MRVALTYRVLPHWRVPVFRRLARWPGIQFRAFHGGDFPGTPTVNGKDLSGFDHTEMWTLRMTRASAHAVAGLPFCPTLLWHLVRFRPDVILAEGNSNLLNNFLVFFYATLTRTPVVFWTLGELRHDRPLSAVQRLFRWVTRVMEKRSAALLGYSSRAIEYFDRQGYPKERQFRAVNCVDTDEVQKRIDRARDQVEPLRAKLNLQGRRVLLYVGSITGAKRLEDLIAVYARLRARFPDLALLLVGDGAHRPVLEKLVQDQQVPDVIFAGQVIEGVSSYFLLGDIFVLPWLGGLAISEAMAHSLPVLVTEADGCEVDLVEEGKNGFVLPLGDQRALETCLTTMLEQPEQIDAMGLHSRWIIDHRYNIHTYMENVVRAIEYAHDGRGTRGQKVPAKLEPTR